MFYLQAKHLGADVVVMPEQWSVGYEENFPVLQPGPVSLYSTPL